MIKNRIKVIRVHSPQSMIQNPDTDRGRPIEKSHDHGQRIGIQDQDTGEPEETGPDLDLIHMAEGEIDLLHMTEGETDTLANGLPGMRS